MPVRSDGKSKILFLQKIFFEDTDEDHPLSATQLIARLQDYGIEAERKSVYRDIEILREFGMDIIDVRGKTFGYYLGSRDIELPELKVMIDAVQSSRFLTPKKSGELIEKLEKLTSRHIASGLHKYVRPNERLKTQNEHIYYVMDAIMRGMSRGVNIAFFYFEYDTRKHRRMKNGGNKYVVSPYSLTWVDDNYYLLAHYKPHGTPVSHFRADRIVDVTLMEEPLQQPDPGFKIAEYVARTFSMFSGQVERVTLRFDNGLVNPAVDRYGESVVLRPRNDGTFEITVEVAVSPTFYSWVFQFGGKVEITGPEAVISKYRDMLKTCLQKTKASLESH